MNICGDNCIFGRRALRDGYEKCECLNRVQAGLVEARSAVEVQIIRLMDVADCARTFIGEVKKDQQRLSDIRAARYELEQALKRFFETRAV